jgi:hypothetical protein
MWPSTVQGRAGESLNHHQMMVMVMVIMLMVVREDEWAVCWCGLTL